MVLLALKFHHIPRKVNVSLIGLFFKGVVDDTKFSIPSILLKKKRQIFFSCDVMWRGWN